jgi:rhodanese-related sulfurtransferase
MNQKEFFSAKLEFEIDACDLNKVVNAEGSIYVIVDTRSEKAFNKEHIKGAINLPYGNMNAETVRHLDKNKIFVTYCDGLGCNASTKGALRLTELNFKVKELIGGIESWILEGHDISSNLSDEEHAEALSCGHECSCHN